MTRIADAEQFAPANPSHSLRLPTNSRSQTESLTLSSRASARAARAVLANPERARRQHVQVSQSSCFMRCFRWHWAHKMQGNRAGFVPGNTSVSR